MSRLGRMICVAAAVGACGTDEPPRSMTVSVFEHIPAMRCRAFLPSDPMDPALPLTFDRCPMDGDAEIIAGGAQLTLVIDYGGVPFAESTDVTPPVVVTTIDGVPGMLGVAPIAERDGGRAFFEITFPAPARPGTQLGIFATAATGFSRALPNSFALVAPELRITVEQCADTATCALVASVGTAAVHVIAGATTAQIGALVSILDGASQPNPIPLDIKTPLKDGRVESVTHVPVPAGSMWSLQATVGTSVAPFGPIMLASPLVAATLGCGTVCAAGAQTTLMLTAPRGIHPAQGSVVVTVGNAPLITNGAVPLTVENVGEGTISGTMPLALPDAPGKTVVVNALVAGYPATTISTTLQ